MFTVDVKTTIQHVMAQRLVKCVSTIKSYKKLTRARVIVNGNLTKKMGINRNEHPLSLTLVFVTLDIGKETFYFLDSTTNDHSELPLLFQWL